MSVGTLPHLGGTARPAPPGAPRVASAHLVGAAPGRALLDVASGRLFAVDKVLGDSLQTVMETGDDDRVRRLMAAAGLLNVEAPPPVPTSVPVRSISLAIAGTCNLACTYCYAEQGGFGGGARAMPQEVAFAAIDRLVAHAAPGESVRIVFLGGEPLVNRALLRKATEHALDSGAAAGVTIDLSLTTNATLLTANDAEFLDKNRFAVTISIDGVGAANDRLRPTRGGRGTYARILERSRHLLDRPGRQCRLFARASVTPVNLDLPETLLELARHGFDSIHFSPVLSAPTGQGEMSAKDLTAMLDAMVSCGRLFEERLSEGQVLPFANLLSTFRQIHARARDEYPCAAGGSYAGVSARGGLYACHRFVDSPDARLGDVADGVDPALQRGWLDRRNLRSQEPCTTCWARHLCGGGCHFEVVRRGRPACDFIRGWLDYCLHAYVELQKNRPDRLAALLRSGR